MVTMAQSAANWRNMHTHVDHTHSLTHLHQHIYNHVKRSASSAIMEFGIKVFTLKVPERGSKPEYPEKPQPANRYHILEKKIQGSGRELNPIPPTLVISSPGQERVPHLTHYATDRCFMWMSVGLCIYAFMICTCSSCRAISAQKQKQKQNSLTRNSHF